MSMLRDLVTLPGSLYELARLGVMTRFRFKGAYWQWRLHTAYGRGYPDRRALVRATIEYGRWVRRMRRH